MQKLKMNKEQWLKMYTDIHEMIMHRYTAPEKLTHAKFVDIRYDILILENINEFEEGEEYISFIPDEEFKAALDEGLTSEQKKRLKELKKSKEDEQILHSMDDILKIFDEEDKDE